jgi:heat shock protein HtpX
MNSAVSRLHATRNFLQSLLLVVALLAQLGLSRVREFEADRAAAELTGDPGALARALLRIERVTRSWRAWFMPGWGNPEPSWLRTHPHTEERIERLKAMTHAPLPALAQVDALSLAGMRPRRSAGWHPGGFWY